MDNPIDVYLHYDMSTKYLYDWYWLTWNLIFQLEKNIRFSDIFELFIRRSYLLPSTSIVS